jgi:hypothetical protein
MTYSYGHNSTFWHKHLKYCVTVVTYQELEYLTSFSWHPHQSLHKMSISH